MPKKIEKPKRFGVLAAAVALAFKVKRFLIERTAGDQRLFY